MKLYSLQILLGKIKMSQISFLLNFNWDEPKKRGTMEMPFVRFKVCPFPRSLSPEPLVKILEYVRMSSNTKGDWVTEWQIFWKTLFLEFLGERVPKWDF